LVGNIRKFLATYACGPGRDSSVTKFTLDRLAHDSSIDDYER
jgi:hypothetical protein